MEEKEKLQLLVKECNSFAEILRKLGKSNSGVATKLLKQKLDDLEINYSFVKKKDNKHYTLDEILQENTYYQSSKLKKRLIDAGLKTDVCEICGQNSIWNNKILTLQLDHINGNHYDNRLENLRIVCPNCHSQLETSGGKRLKKKNFCIDCGKEISNKATRCPKCAAKYTANLKNKNVHRPTKEELTELLKTKSFVEIGKIYGVKDNAVRKWCKNMNLPYLLSDIKKEFFGETHIPIKVVNCLNCGNEFKQHSNTSKFCSMKCYREYVKSNK